MSGLDDLRETPWDAYDWEENVYDLDQGLRVRVPWDPSAYVLAEIEASYDQGDGWDGKVGALVRLEDGRYAAWTSWYGPTGSGFCADAYGGQAEVFIGSDRAQVIEYGLTESARKQLGLMA